MEYFKWVVDKCVAFAIGILINLVTPDKSVSIIITIAFVVLFLSVSIFLYYKYPKALGMKTSYAATGIVFNSDYSEVLLTYHKNQKMWIPPGGHAMKTEWLHDKVVSLIKAESGYDVEFFPFHVSHVFDNICTVVPQPFRVQVEKQIKGEGHDTHYDFLYIFTVKSNSQDNPSQNVRWVPIEQIDNLASRRETYQDVADIVKAALGIINSIPQKEETK